jgi:hypothetical protein
MLVAKQFKDKFTKEVYKVGSKYAADKKRMDELVKLGYLKAEAKPKKQGD